MIKKIQYTTVALLLLSAMEIFAQNAITNPALPHLNSDSLKIQAAAIKKANMELAARTKYQYFNIKAEGSTYGNSIFTDGHQYIWQTSIPAMRGNKGFATEALAVKCAELVIQKIKHGEMPPSLTEEELKSNNLIN